MSHLLPRFTAAMQKIADAEKIGRILRETGDPGRSATPAKATGGRKQVGRRSAEGDPFRLRGIPVVARKIGGTSPGTDPLAELLRADRYSRYPSQGQ